MHNAPENLEKLCKNHYHYAKIVMQYNVEGPLWNEFSVQIKFLFDGVKGCPGVLLKINELICSMQTKTALTLPEESFHSDIHHSEQCCLQRL